MRMHDALILPSIVEGRALVHKKHFHVGCQLSLHQIQEEKIW